MGGKRTGVYLILAMACAAGAGAVEYKRERYQVILERSPFGEDPTLAQEDVNQAKEDAAAAAAAKALEKEIRLCFLMETDGGEFRAGFQNLKPQKGDPSSVLLMEGESFKGMKLSKIDIANNSATLINNGKPVTFELAKAPAAAKPARPAPSSTTRRFNQGFQRPEQPTKPAQPELTEEELAKRAEVQENLRQYQMEVIRAGMPPLPIPLTKDMDDQLVAEGVLPPGAD
ncbi:hypothetical protein [Pontiella sp.]|uniref:hypothetical protein n=1 Tax=Pontiella sp. TaxID=2837462 RepID=UPI003569B802